ncbi:hypothetical protein KKH07_02610 [Patescibacteria group bacterium]|nr:hypothetical protein [Patescibacteria group bacterium]MBU1563516.1 hypothetical protein [Patescibacteria group bacterium]
MKLDELQKKLYKPEAEFEDRLEGPEAFDIDRKREKKDVAQEWQKIEKRQLSPQWKKKIRIISISVIIVFLITAGFFIWRGFTSFDKNGVVIEIYGAERVVSGEEVKYLIKYNNNTRLVLENLKLVFHYPKDSIPANQQSLDETIDLPDLAPGQEKEIELLVRIIGLRGENQKAWVELSYQPVGISSQYTNVAEFISQVISVPLILDFDLPEKLVTGQDFDFSLRYLNQAEVSFDDIRIRIDYPAGFVFESANLNPLEDENNNVWSLGKLMAGEQSRISIRGNIQGKEGEVKSFKAQLGIFQNEEFTPYSETVGALQISNSPLSISQTVNESTNYIAQANQILTYQINYQNTTDIGIKNVVITSKLEGKVLDFTSLELGSGSFNGDTQTITWNASNVSNLALLGPYQKGQLSFSIRIKNPLPINGYSDKNFIVNNEVKIDSLEVPLSLKDIEITGQSKMTTKIASQLTLQSQGYYYDDLITNSGPIPPKVSQTTSYTIKWRLVNTSNDLKNVKVIGSLPPHVNWNNRVSGTGLTYNSQTGQIIWSVGDLQAATGVLLPVKEVAFQISITPSLAHLGNLVELISQSQASGQDNFVDLALTNTDESIDTDLPDDLMISQQQGRVIE